ncbi:MAG: phenylalanine--tRNA ligase beta subunit-related protein [Thermomicrobiales bacterium]
MHILHSPDIWRDFPRVVPGVLAIEGIRPDVDVTPRVAAFERVAAERLATGTESDLAEIQAWRRAFARMGLKPTQYRSASESLLRRFRKEETLPRLHPLIDLCNAVSLAFAIPIATFDVTRLTGHVEVRYANGTETFETFSGETEHPDPDEVIFADEAGRAHARRWCHRQSAFSAVRDTTSSVLIVAEAMHDDAALDIPRLITTLAAEVSGAWSVPTTSAVLSAASPRFDV